MVFFHRLGGLQDGNLSNTGMLNGAANDRWSFDIEALVWHIYSGWWCGTFFISNILGIIIPID